LNLLQLLCSFLLPFLLFVLFTLIHPIKSKREDYYREYDLIAKIRFFLECTNFFRIFFYAVAPKKKKRRVLTDAPLAYKSNFYYKIININN
jgi:hypothetical protein